MTLFRKIVLQMLRCCTRHWGYSYQEYPLPYLFELAFLDQHFMHGGGPACLLQEGSFGSKVTEPRSRV